MHLLVEVRTPAFAIILDAKRFDLALVQDPINTGFGDSGKSVKAFPRSSFIDMLRKGLGGPGLSGIAEVLWLRAGHADKPGLRLAGDLLLATATFANIEEVLDGIPSERVGYFLIHSPAVCRLTPTSSAIAVADLPASFRSRIFALWAIRTGGIPEILIIICSPQNTLPRCPIKQKGRHQVAVLLIDVVLIDIKNYILLHL